MRVSANHSASNSNRRNLTSHRGLATDKEIRFIAANYSHAHAHLGETCKIRAPLHLRNYVAQKSLHPPSAPSCTSAHQSASFSVRPRAMAAASLAATASSCTAVATAGWDVSELAGAAGALLLTGMWATSDSGDYNSECRPLVPSLEAEGKFTKQEPEKEEVAAPIRQAFLQRRNRTFVAEEKKVSTNTLATSAAYANPVQEMVTTIAAEARAQLKKANQEPVALHKNESLEVSVRALKGRRMTMEDEYIVDDGGRFVAVFDGHGGGGVSRYLRERLHQRIKYYLGEIRDERQESLVPADGPFATEAESEDVRKTRSFVSFLRRTESGRTPQEQHGIAVANQMSALRSAFRTVDREILTDDRFHYMGSTAVAVMVQEKETNAAEKSLIVANIGDSRAVLSSNKVAVELTRDHKPYDATERARIAALGETVEWDGYVYRVRDLSLSRAIGDRFAKPAVSSEVDISRYEVNANKDEFVVLASDGLWDVMGSQETVDFVNEKMADLDDGLPPQLAGNVLGDRDVKLVNGWKRKNMSRFLANEAMRRGTRDNVCVVIVWLQDDKDEDVVGVESQ